MINNIAVLGAALGDEAKGRASHWMAKDFDWVIRFSGSQNAGHTIYHDGKKLIRHALPCADFSTGNRAFLASGMVINLEELLKEIQETETAFPGSASRISIDPDAFVVLPKHLEEDKENVVKYGSTARGVSPCYHDKINRCGTKIGALLRDRAEVVQAIQATGAKFQYASELMDTFRNSRLLFEGAQSLLLEVGFGAYPYVSSGQSSLGGICDAGFASLLPTRVYGVMKPYITCVGRMPFPTELFGKDAEELQEKGCERGSTTGRLRRVGALDFPALRYAISKGAITDLIITKLDVLNGRKPMAICCQYQKGDPKSGNDFFTATPVMEELTDIIPSFSGWDDANEDWQLRSFINLVERETERNVSYISWGTGENEMKELL